MHRANVTIIRECYPIATMDEVFQSLNQSIVFSKLDLKSGHHQLELHPDSYSITTFIIQCGLLQYKHLYFQQVQPQKCISMHVIQQALTDGEGVANISNGIIVHGKTTEEHDESSKRVLEKLK